MTEPLAKNQIYTVVTDGYASDGSAVCRVNGRAIFVAGALSGETWRIRILKATASAVYAKGEELIIASPHRIPPDCPYFPQCGGCSLRHMSYEEELRFKLERVNSALSRIGGLDFQIPEILSAGGVTRYRNKAIYAVGGSVSEPVAGFYKPRSHDIVPVCSCLIQHPVSDRITNAVLAWMRELRIAPYDESSGKGQVRHIFSRVSFSSGSAMACIVSARGFGAAASDALVRALTSACPELTGVVLNINKTRGNTVLAGDFYTLWGSGTLEDTLCGLKFELSPTSFFQINPAQTEKLYGRALEYALPEKTGAALDLYCGAGTISLCLARRAGRVIGAEIVEAAVANARENARRNGITNAEFICADAGEAALDMASRGLRPDVIVVDPPRKGLSPDTIDAVVRMSPERLVYVSCDPGTLARDLRVFAQRGYLPSAGTAVDMFPRSPHVETVVLLSRKMPDDVIDIDLELDELDITSAEAKATYQEIKDYVQDKFGFPVI